MPAAGAEELRARFVELAPEGFEERELSGAVELAAYGSAAERVVAALPDATVTEVEPGWEERWREFHRPVRVGPLWIGPPLHLHGDKLPDHVDSEPAPPPNTKAMPRPR